MPSASTIEVSREARFRTSLFDPIATNRPFLTAKASARGRESSMVRTRPLTRMRSGRRRVDGAVGLRGPGRECRDPCPRRRRRTVEETRNRVYFAMLISPGVVLIARANSRLRRNISSARAERNRPLEGRYRRVDLVSLQSKSRRARSRSRRPPGRWQERGGGLRWRGARHRAFSRRSRARPRLRPKAAIARLFSKAAAAPAKFEEARSARPCSRWSTE